MCGRFALNLTPKQINELFQAETAQEFNPRYNVAPSQTIPAVVFDPERSARIVKLFRWGLVPHWAKDTKIGSRMINARAETITEKPSFRTAFKKRRCLIPATGFYEWDKNKRTKNPFHITSADGSSFAFAGLWELWEGEREEILSCTIITTSANEIMQSFHDRMPVILDPGDYDIWLRGETDEETLLPLLRQYPSEKMTVFPVGTLVNSPYNDSPECIRPVP